jgi:hypothetical protein
MWRGYAAPLDLVGVEAVSHRLAPQPLLVGQDRGERLCCVAPEDPDQRCQADRRWAFGQVDMRAMHIRGTSVIIRTIQHTETDDFRFLPTLVLVRDLGTRACGYGG